MHPWTKPVEKNANFVCKSPSPLKKTLTVDFLTFTTHPHTQCCIENQTINQPSFQEAEKHQ